MGRRDKPKKRFQPRSKRRKTEQQQQQQETEDGPRNKQSRFLNWDTINRTNKSFETYYEELGVLSPEEYQEFITCIRSPLPTSFRITSSGGMTDLVQAHIQKYTEPVIVDNVPVAPTKIDWYPNGNGWIVDIPRTALRKSETLAELHGFLVSQTEHGSLSRQEVVSMLPPLLLDVKPHHLVLDMCAAPGSKTTQILEALHADPNIPVPSGMVIANDVEEKRCYMLTHQTKRLSSPCCVITNHSAQSFPSIQMNIRDEPTTTPTTTDTTSTGTPSTDGGSTGGEPAKTTRPLRFDRVLCDVPCSGDGTLRKNPDLWPRWNPAIGLGLHKLQLRIALRGCLLVKIGGRFVYSTCSLNPVENEAVVSQLLVRSKGALRLIDVSDQLPTLKRKPGITSWRVFDKDGKWYSSHSELSFWRQKRIAPSVFPPPPDVVQSLNLHHCIRIFPHLQNTGGFFIAVFEKLSLLPADFFHHSNPANQTRKSDPSSSSSSSSSEQSSSSSASTESSTSSTESTASSTSSEKMEISPEKESSPSSSGPKSEDAKPLTEDDIILADAPVDEDEDDEDLAAAALIADGIVVGQPTAGHDDDDDEEEFGDNGEPKKKKKKEGERKKKEESSSTNGDQETKKEGRPDKKYNRREAPFLPVTENFTDAMDRIKEFYGLLPNFPHDQLFTRSEKSPKIYFVSEAIRDVLNSDKNGRLNVINTGLRLFHKHSAPGCRCDFRMGGEGLPLLWRYMEPKRLLQLSQADLKILLTSTQEPRFTEFSESAQKQFAELENGCYGAKIDVEIPGAKTQLVVPCWRGKNRTSLLISKNDQSSLRVLLEIESPSANKKKRQTTAATQPPTTETTTTTTTTTSDQATTPGQNPPDSTTSAQTVQPEVTSKTESENQK